MIEEDKNSPAVWDRIQKRWGAMEDYPNSLRGVINYLRKLFVDRAKFLQEGKRGESF